MASGGEELESLDISCSLRLGIHSHAEYEQPVEIGAYSTGLDKTFKPDRSELRYYVGPPGQPSTQPLDEGEVELDLNEGMDIGIIHENIAGLTTLLKWILFNPDSLQTVDFICWRGLLKTVMLSPYFWSTNWKIAAVRLQGKIYMCEMATEEELVRKEAAQREEAQKSAFRGYPFETVFPGFKFEQYVTSDRPDGIPNTEEPVNTSKAFYSVVKSSLSNHRLLLAGEVDCVSKEDNGRYIELKSYKEFETDYDPTKFKKFSLANSWAQSYLLGVDRIVYGFKDASGVVRRLKTFKTSKIPEYCSTVRDNRCWTAQGALNFLDDFLHYVKRTVQDNSNSVVYVFERRAHTKPRSKFITCQIEEVSTSQHTVLPDWFTNELA